VNAAINPSCLNTGGVSPAFVTDEIWLVNSDATHWVETGYIQDNNANINGLGNGQQSFWGDDRPGHAFAAHGVASPTLPNEQYLIQNDSNDDYIIFYAGNQIAHSTSNTMNPSYGLYGSETTTTASGNSGNWTGVQYYTNYTQWNDGVVNPLYHYEQPFAWTTFDTSFKAGNAC